MLLITFKSRSCNWPLIPDLCEVQCILYTQNSKPTSKVRATCQNYYRYRADFHLFQVIGFTYTSMSAICIVNVIQLAIESKIITRLWYRPPTTSMAIIANTPPYIFHPVVAPTPGNAVHFSATSKPLRSSAPLPRYVIAFHLRPGHTH